MNEERTGKCLRQVEHIRGHLGHKYSIAVNQVMVTTVKFRSDDQQLPCQQQPSIKEMLIGITSSGISYHLRDIYSICRCCWNDATYKWKVHNGKIKIISFVVMFQNMSTMSISKCISQGMKQTQLYLWYPLFQAQWDICDQQKHKAQNCLVKGHKIKGSCWNLFVFLWKYRCEVYLVRIRETIGERWNAVVFHANSDCLLNNTSIKLNYCVCSKRVTTSPCFRICHFMQKVTINFIDSGYL